tara:strand:+ start:3543 stop:4163 length:621 start_codon:yes stop_codon:yes gene_type:complete
MPVIDSIKVAQTGPEVPSPWWLKGGAIFIGVLGISSLIGAVSLAISGIAIDAMMADMDPEELCQDDPEREECEEFIRSLSSMSEMSLWDVGAALSAFLFLLSIPTVILMWNAEDRGIALKLAWSWVAVHAVSQFYLIHSYMVWMDEFYESIPMEEMGWAELFTKVASYGSILMCELSMAAGLVLISYKTRPPTALEMPSAFHVSEE